MNDKDLDEIGVKNYEKCPASGICPLHGVTAVKFANEINSLKTELFNCQVDKKDCKEQLRAKPPRWVMTMLFGIVFGLTCSSFAYTTLVENRWAEERRETRTLQSEERKGLQVFQQKVMESFELLKMADVASQTERKELREAISSINRERDTIDKLILQLSRLLDRYAVIDEMKSRDMLKGRNNKEN